MRAPVLTSMRTRYLSLIYRNYRSLLYSAHVSAVLYFHSFPFSLSLCISIYRYYLSLYLYPFIYLSLICLSPSQLRLSILELNYQFSRHWQRKWWLNKRNTAIIILKNRKENANWKLNRTILIITYTIWTFHIHIYISIYLYIYTYMFSFFFVYFFLFYFQFFLYFECSQRNICALLSGNKNKQ